jgi:hypothetical protein
MKTTGGLAGDQERDAQTDCSRRRESGEARQTNGREHAID